MNVTDPSGDKFPDPNDIPFFAVGIVTSSVANRTSVVAVSTSDSCLFFLPGDFFEKKSFFGLRSFNRLGDATEGIFYIVSNTRLNLIGTWLLAIAGTRVKYSTTTKKEAIRQNRYKNDTTD